MKKMAFFFLVAFLVAWVYQSAMAQSLEGTWVRTITLETECPGLPMVSEDFTDTVTYSEFDQTIELPEQYQHCELEEDGGQWSLDCAYDQEMDLCVYHFHLTGNGGLEDDEFDFQFTAEYTISGGPACLLIPLCVVRGTIHGDRIFATSVDEWPTEAGGLIPATHYLFQNCPNPFNPTTSIQYSVVSDQTTHHSPPVTLKIYNVLGQEVRTLVDEVNKPGIYTVRWDGTDRSGRGVSGGFYFCRLKVNEYTHTRCMLLLK